MRTAYLYLLLAGILAVGATVAVARKLTRR